MNMESSLWYQRIFTALKNPPCSVSTLSAPNNHSSFNCLHSFAFSRMLYSWKHTVYSCSDCVIFLSTVHLKVPPCLFMASQLISFFFCFFFFFMATSAAYESFHARGPIGAAAATFYPSHSKTRSDSHLQPTPQLRQFRILYPLSQARYWTCILTRDGVRSSTHWATRRTPHNSFLHSTEWYPIVWCITLYPFTYQRPHWLLRSFDNYE